MSQALASTITASAAAARPWDVVIVGAGPAGGMAGLLLSRRGRRVLIVERARMPREKACGCCLSSLGVSILIDHGLESLVRDALPLEAVEIRHGDQRVSVPLPPGRAIRRSVLDTALVRAAIDAGADYLDEHVAHLLPGRGTHRQLDLRHGEGATRVSASLVLACDGIRGSTLDTEPGCGWHISDDAWMGAALTMEHSPSMASLFRPGVIHMHVGTPGYVGVVRLSDTCVHLAAALDPAQAKARGGPRAVMGQILRECRVEKDLPDGLVTGTPLLTRRRRMLGGHRVLAIGDAGGYIEPFTGEGMTWALSSAVLLADALPEDLTEWFDDAPQHWTTMNHHYFRHHHQLCRAFRYVLHRPALHRAAIGAMWLLPAAAAEVVRIINHPARAGAAI